MPRLLRNNAETLADAVAAGKVNIEGAGSWHSGFFPVRLSKTAPGPDLELAIPLGTMFLARNPNTQDIVVAGVRRKYVRGTEPEDGTRTITTSANIVIGNDPVEYVLDGYCANYYKTGPGRGASFQIGPPNRALVCILEIAVKRSLETGTTQHAVWNRTDNLEFGPEAADVAQGCAAVR